MTIQLEIKLEKKVQKIRKTVFFPSPVKFGFYDLVPFPCQHLNYYTEFKLKSTYISN
jgi:hypothetical protein